MLVDDDAAIRCMLQDIIEDYDLGDVADTRATAIDIDNTLLTHKRIDILIIDMLMPGRDGIQTVKAIQQDFSGKIIMLSQVESKELIGNAYALGVDAYITKPINRNEVVSVIRNACEHLRLKKFVHNIESNLQSALRPNEFRTVQAEPSLSIQERGSLILKELGISGENGAPDLLAVLDDLAAQAKDAASFPPLKTIFARLAGKRHSPDAQKEAKAIEQRLRRTIFQALVNLASIGIEDYANPKFEDYAPRYFDFNEVRAMMRTLKQDKKPQISQAHINSKKFLRTFFMDSCK